MKLFATLLIAATTSGQALARSGDALEREVDRAFSASYHSCIKSAPNIPALGDCTRRETEVQDARLNRIYRGVMARLSDTERNRLRTAERAWVRRRDPICEAYAVKIDGSAATSMSALINLDCVLKATTRRAILIERYGAGRVYLADLVRDHRS